MPPRRGSVSGSRAILLVVGVGAVFLAGLAIHGPLGGVLLLLVAATLVLFSLGAWSHLRREGRPLRILVIAAVLGLAALKLASRI